MNRTNEHDSLTKQLLTICQKAWGQEWKAHTLGVLHIQGEHARTGQRIEVEYRETYFEKTKGGGHAKRKWVYVPRGVNGEDLPFQISPAVAARVAVGAYGT